MLHETPWITQDIGTAPAPRRGAPGTRVELERGRASGAGLGELGVAVARGLAAWGERALAPKPVPGAPRKLTDAQCEPLVQLLLQGARANGFPNELWTLKRLAAVIQVHFGVRYHPTHAWKILRGLGWSCQVPERRAIQRDDQAIAHWTRYQ
jgi:transposase